MSKVTRITPSAPDPHPAAIFHSRLSEARTTLDLLHTLVCHKDGDTALGLDRGTLAGSLYSIILRIEEAQEAGEALSEVRP